MATKVSSIQSFYLDIQPSPEETASIIESLNAIDGLKIEALDYIRIPHVFPVEGDVAVNLDKLYRMFRNHLIKAGAVKGKQALFIMPKNEARWASLIQGAFSEETGYYPYVVQPWELAADKLLARRNDLFVIDMHSMMNAD